MDAQERDPDDRLSADALRLLEAARRRGFRALMLTLDRLRPGSATALGGAATPHEESIRFRHDPSLAFSTADVVSVREVELPADAAGVSRRAVEVTTSFLGLTGEVSPLPPYMAEEIAQEVAQEERPPRQRDFLDLFHHRAISLLHRGLAKHDVPGSARSDQDDDWSRRILALLGRDVASGVPLPADTPPRWALLRLAPLLAERALSAAALEACLADLLAGELRGAAVAVEQFVGAWVTLAADERTRLGTAASALGRSLVLGERIYDRTGRFRVVIGPLDAEGYDRFSSPDLARRVLAVAGALAGGDLDVELVLRLAPHAAPGFALSSDGRYRLGRNTWLGRQGVETRVTVDGRPAAPRAA
jgi:type VI secretion system protein ImpH